MGREEEPDEVDGDEADDGPVFADTTAFAAPAPPMAADPLAVPAPEPVPMQAQVVYEETKPFDKSAGMALADLDDEEPGTTEEAPRQKAAPPKAAPAKRGFPWFWALVAIGSLGVGVSFLLFSGFGSVVFGVALMSQPSTPEPVTVSAPAPAPSEPVATPAPSPPPAAAPERQPPTGADPEVHYRAGVAALKAENYPEAERELLACLQLNPDHVECRYELGWAYWSMNQWEDVIDTWDDIPDHPKVQKWLPKARAKR